MKAVDLRLYALVDPEHSGGHDIVELARSLAQGGATLVQLRDKGSATRLMVERARSIKSALRPFAVPMARTLDRMTWPSRTRAGCLVAGQSSGCR